jgi:predicted DNA-binding transcriptional regulator YafY
MSRRESISRYNLIIKKLRRAPATFNEIAGYLKRESELQDYDFNVSKRTFQRDLNEIRSLYDIDIQYDFSRRLYFIESDQQTEANERIMEAFDIINAVNLSERLTGFISFEKRKPQGTENFYSLLHAIKDCRLISFTYHKYFSDEVSARKAKPLALKEFRKRWYLLAKDLNDEIVKTFALDRLSDLSITGEKSGRLSGIEVNDYFKHSFGIMGPNAEKPLEVILSFDALQGKYIKSLPLHESQEIIKDDEDELLIKLMIFITHDFIMEILSYGGDVKVISPDSLVAEIKASLACALNQY